MTRRHSPNAVFIFTSTNKVYGDTPNRLPLVEHETRWEIDSSHSFYNRGIDESMSIDRTLHSLYGASKASADLLVQEYGRYFNMKTACFRGGCISGPAHSPARLHGFLAYLVKCAINGKNYTIHGYKGKQVRDVIYGYDLINAFWHFFQKPRVAEVYNIGGGRFSNCSVMEAIKKLEEIMGKKMKTNYSGENRIGDHIWWISDVTKFKSHYPQWEYRYGIDNILLKNFNGIRTSKSQGNWIKIAL
jgi:CDP-paratose 2-epimerase